MITITDNLSAAAAALNDAQDGYGRASRNFEAADSELLDAIAARDALLARAADGAAIGTTDISNANRLIQEAEAAAMLAKAQQTGAKRRMEAAEVALLGQKAGQLVAGWHAAIRQTISAAARVDAALAEARVAFAEFQERFAAQSKAYGAAGAHDLHIRNRARGVPPGGPAENETLAHLEDHEIPWAQRSMGMQPPPKVSVGLLTSAWGETQEFNGSIAGVIASQYSQYLPPSDMLQVVEELAQSTGQARAA